MTLTDYMCEEERGGRGFASIKDSIDTSIQRLEDYIEKRGGRLITVTRNNTNDKRSSGTTIWPENKIEKNTLYGRFKQLTSDISHEKTWTWLRKYVETGEWSLNSSIKHPTNWISLNRLHINNAIRTNHIKARVDKTQQNSRYRLCTDKDEMIDHIISECSQNSTGRNIRLGKTGWAKWSTGNLYKKLKFDHTNKWYMHNPASELENKMHKLLWDFEIQTDH